MNITLEDCIALYGLGESEVAAIAEHEHIPEISAATLAQYLLGRPGGTARDMLVDDLRSAIKRNDKTHAGDLLATLRHFATTHWDALHAAKGDLARRPEDNRRDAKVPARHCLVVSRSQSEALLDRPRVPR